MKEIGHPHTSSQELYKNGAFHDGMARRKRNARAMQEKGWWNSGSVQLIEQLHAGVQPGPRQLIVSDASQNLSVCAHMLTDVADTITIRATMCLNLSMLGGRCTTWGGYPSN